MSGTNSPQGVGASPTAEERRQLPPLTQLPVQEQLRDYRSKRIGAILFGSVVYLLGLWLIVRPFSRADGLGGYYFAGDTAPLHVLDHHRRAGTLTFNAASIHSDHACELLSHPDALTRVPKMTDATTESESTTPATQDLKKCLEAFAPLNNLRLMDLDEAYTGKDPSVVSELEDLRSWAIRYRWLFFLGIFSASLGLLLYLITAGAPHAMARRSLRHWGFVGVLFGALFLTASAPITVMLRNCAMDTIKDVLMQNDYIKGIWGDIDAVTPLDDELLGYVIWGAILFLVSLVPLAIGSFCLDKANHNSPQDAPQELDPEQQTLLNE